MQTQFEEKLHDDVVVRRSQCHPKLWASKDGRVLGINGHWLKPQKRNAAGYLAVNYRLPDCRNKSVLIHRLVAEVWISNPLGLLQVDHISGDITNNAIENLRWSSNRQNCQNKSCHRHGFSSSQYVGVCWSKQKGKWIAQIQTNGCQKKLGSFDDEISAANAYDNALLALGMAPVNFPNCT